MLVTSALGYPVSAHHPAAQHHLAGAPGAQYVAASVSQHPSISPALSTSSGIEYPGNFGENALMINPNTGEMANLNLATGTMVDSAGQVVATSPITLQQVSPSMNISLSTMAATDLAAHQTHLGDFNMLSSSPKLNGNINNHSAGQQNNVHSTAEYLQQLLKDRNRLAAFPGTFIHAERLLDAEIARIRSSLFQINNDEKKPLVLPEPDGPVIMRTEKVYVPVEEHPDFNFVGRILGPRGMTAKQLEQETGCKIMVRGRGSMRDKKKEEQNRGKPNWEHLNDKLHVLITVEDTENRAQLKLNRAIDEVKKLLVPITEGEDELKKRQLMELAIINGTYRDSAQRNTPQQQCLTLGLDPEQLKSLTIPVAALASHANQMVRHQQQLGTPLILGHRQYAGHHHSTTSALLNGNAAAAAAAAAVAAAQPPPLIATSSDGSTLLYTTATANPYAAEFHPAHHHHHHQYHTLGASPLIDFSAAAAAAAGTPVIDATSGSSNKEKRARTTLTSRYHPYDGLVIHSRATSS